MKRGSVIIWTRSLEDWANDKELLDGLGVPYLHLPCLRLEPLSVPAETLGRLTQSGIQQIFVFTSSHAVACAMAHPQLQRAVKAAHAVLVVGAATKDALAEFGVNALLPAGVTRGEELGDYLVAASWGPEAVFFLPGGRQRAYDLQGRLGAAGLKAATLDLYEQKQGLSVGGREGGLRGEAKAAYLTGISGVTCFASPSAVSGFCEGLTGALPSSNFTPVVIGPTTAAACAPYFQQVSLADQPSIKALLAKAVAIFKGLA